MHVNINTLSEVLHEAEITLTPEELQPHFERAYDKERERIEIKGFRKGKAPLSMIKRMYGEAIEHNVLDVVANEYYARVMDERNISPIGQPAMVDMDYRRGEQLRFRIQYETRPDIRLRDYKGVTVERPVHRVTDDEVESELRRIRRLNSTTAPAETVTDEEHVVTVDVQELDQAGTPLIGRKARDMAFYLADESLSGEIRESLRRAAVGGTYRARIEASEEGKPATSVDLQVTKIDRVALPPLDEALVSKLTDGKVMSVETFRQQMRSDLEKHWEDWSDRKLADAISAEIVRAHNFPVPESLVSTLIDSFVEDLRSRSRTRELPRDFNEQKFREESRELAVWQAKWMLLKDRIAEEEKISVGETDIEEAVARDSEQNRIPKERLLEYYQKSPAVRERLLSKKIMNFLVSHARITEKVFDHVPHQSR
jgi:trigger factor